MEGYVYILLNSAFPDLVKIGKTTKHPAIRAKELNQTGVPAPFMLAYFERVSDCDTAERVAHEELASFRANKDREFFRLDSTAAIGVISRVCRPFSLDANVPASSASSPQSSKRQILYLAHLHPWEDCNKLTLPLRVVDNKSFLDEFRHSLEIEIDNDDSHESRVHILQTNPQLSDHRLCRIGFTNLSASNLRTEVLQYVLSDLEVLLTPSISVYQTNVQEIDLSEPLFELGDCLASRQEQLVFAHKAKLAKLVDKVQALSIDEQERVRADAERREHMMEAQRRKKVI